MRILTRSEIVALLPVVACIDVMEAAMTQVSRREVVLPLRQFMPVPDTKGKLGLMPGYIGDPASFGVKIVSKYERPAGSLHGTHVGAVMLFDATEGLPLALLEGGSLTAIRTSAASALATRALARPDATRLALLGCGEEAHHHLESMLAVRPINQVLVWGRSADKAAAFVAHNPVRAGVHIAVADSVAQALAEADIVCTVTSATAPFLEGRWIQPGTHLNLVGSAIPTTAEVDSEAVARSRFYVDYRLSALAQAGELLTAIKEGVVTEDHIIGEIGEVLLGAKPGRVARDDITIYKSLGVTAQDLAAAHFVFEEAKRRGIGREIDLAA
jgi:ornithine cyclodeaminase